MSESKEKPPQESKSFWSNLPLILTGVAGVITAVTALITAWPTNIPQPTPTSAPVASLELSVRIDGPAEATLLEETHFTIISKNAVRAEWAVGGFNNNEIIHIPSGELTPSYQIKVSPNNETRINETFTIIVTVFDADGSSESTEKEFKVVSN